MPSWAVVAEYFKAVFGGSDVERKKNVLEFEKECQSLLNFNIFAVFVLIDGGQWRLIPIWIFTHVLLKTW